MPAARSTTHHARERAIHNTSYVYVTVLFVRTAPDGATSRTSKTAQTIAICGWDHDIYTGTGIGAEAIGGNAGRGVEFDGGNNSCFRNNNGAKSIMMLII